MMACLGSFLVADFGVGGGDSCLYGVCSLRDHPYLRTRAVVKFVVEVDMLMHSLEVENSSCTVAKY